MMATHRSAPAMDDFFKCKSGAGRTRVPSGRWGWCRRRITMTPRLDRPAADECSLYYGTYIQLVPEGDIVETLRAQHHLRSLRDEY